jgi:mono/diheme cytochrome c family protein
MNNAIPATFRGLLVSGVMAMVAITWSAAADSKGVVSEGDVNRGATTWSYNCARCHEMRGPTEFRDDIWKPIVAHMRVRAGLTGQQQRDVLAFLQASNSPQLTRRVVAADDSPGTGLSGQDIYGQTCVACHGPAGTGALPGTPDFTKSGGPLAKSDDDLIHNISVGFQSPGSPMAMPAKGGNSALNAADVRAVLDYLRESFSK